MQGGSNFLAALVAAIALNELIHNMFEIWGIRQKIAWLTARMDKKPHGNWPININSLSKTLLLHGFIFMVFVSLIFGFFVLMEFKTDTLLLIAIVSLVLTYSYTTLSMDTAHSEIGHLLKRYKRH